MSDFMRWDLFPTLRCPLCDAPPSRRVVHDAGTAFFPRVGCLECNKWFDKPRLSGLPTEGLKRKQEANNDND